MLNFRQFEAGPDPFGRTFQVLFRYQQNGISIRHANTVEAGFALTGSDGTSMVKTISLPYPELLEVAAAAGRPLDDAWASRLAALHLKWMIETGQDMEKDLVTVARPDLERHAAALKPRETGG